MKFEILYFLIVFNSYLVHQYQVGKVVDKVGMVYNEEGYEDEKNDQLHLHIEDVCFPIYITL